MAYFGLKVSCIPKDSKTRRLRTSSEVTVSSGSEHAVSPTAVLLVVEISTERWVSLQRPAAKRSFSSWEKKLKFLKSANPKQIKTTRNYTFHLLSETKGPDLGVQQLKGGLELSTPDRKTGKPYMTPPTRTRPSQPSQLQHDPLKTNEAGISNAARTGNLVSSWLIKCVQPM